MSFTQPLRAFASAKAAADGTALFTFDATPQSHVWTGTVVVTGAPGTAQFTAQVGGLPWATWLGPAPSPAVQLTSREQLTVIAVGLNSGVTLTAALMGVATDDEAAPFVQPSGAQGFPSAGNMAASAVLAPPDTTQVLVAAPAATQRVILYTCQIVYVDSATAAGTFIADASGVPIFSAQGTHVPPSFGYMGGYLCQAGSALNFQTIGGGAMPAGTTARANVTYLIGPAPT